MIVLAIAEYVINGNKWNGIHKKGDILEVSAPTPMFNPKEGEWPRSKSKIFEIYLFIISHSLNNLQDWKLPLIERHTNTNNILTG